MIEAGVLKNPDVEGIIGLHLWNNLPLGTVGVKNGALMAAVECFDLQIQGRRPRGNSPSNRRFTTGGGRNRQRLANHRRSQP
jgi:amidohydrolase